MKRKLIFFGGAALILAVAAYLLFARHSGANYDFRFDRVSKGDLIVNVTATGTINAVTSVDVGTQVSGIISRLYADFNSIVKEGQVIAQIDPTFLQQSVKDAQANLERAQAQHADSKRVYERTKSLFDKLLESQVNYDATLTTLESNQAALKQAQATLDRAKINLAYATIYAPINGVVIDRKVNVGQTVAASFSSPTLFTIANDLKKMQVQATVDESDIGTVSVGQQATFTVDAYPDETFSGTVSQIRLAPTSIQNVVNYTVIIDVDNNQLKLMPGMTANVKILIAGNRNVLRVPNMALRFQPPADLIDSAKIKAQREAFLSARSGDESARAEGQDSTTKGAPGPGHTVSGGSQQTRGSSMASAERPSGLAAPDQRIRFRALRDSIMAAHGGEMSPEDFRLELQKVIGTGSAAGSTAMTIVSAPSRQSDATKYGVTQRFPEYQKSAYIPAQKSTRGRVWILDATGKLEPVPVRIGLSDGRYTEITSSTLKDGDQIIMGVSSNSESASDQTRSPLAGQAQRPVGGLR